MEKKTDDVAGGEKTFDEIARGVEHLSAFVDLQAAEGECNSPGDGVRPVRWLIKSIGTNGFFRRASFCASAVELGGI